jgi:hypothetical protein
MAYRTPRFGAAAAHWVRRVCQHPPRQATRLLKRRRKTLLSQAGGSRIRDWTLQATGAAIDGATNIKTNLHKRWLG